MSCLKFISAIFFLSLQICCSNFWSSDFAVLIPFLSKDHLHQQSESVYVEHVATRLAKHSFIWALAGSYSIILALCHMQHDCPAAILQQPRCDSTSSHSISRCHTDAVLWASRLRNAANSRLSPLHLCSAKNFGEKYRARQLALNQALPALPPLCYQLAWGESSLQRAI